jgi:3-hydroxyacyl-[acyl-carrier-protein] dehydratase
MDIIKILSHQKNRFPYLFIDQITSLEPGKRVVAIKAFTYNEMFFPGHFDDEPNVPGFIQVECLVQTFLMSFQSMSEYSGLKASDSEFKNVRFQRKIVPGEVLQIEAILNSIKRGVATGYATSSVDGEPACSAEFVVAIPDILQNFKPKI